METLPHNCFEPSDVLTYIFKTAVDIRNGLENGVSMGIFST